MEEDSELVMIFPKPFGVFDRSVHIRERGEGRKGEEITENIIESIP